MSHHLVIWNWRGCYSACLTICVGACVGCHRPSSGVPVYAAKVRVSPVASQCGADSTKFLQWHSSVGLFQLSFSSGIPVYTGSTSGIPVYTGPASVHWLRVRVVSQLQRCQNNAACIVSLRRKYDHITPVLKDLHWLPVEYRINYKILLLAYKAQHDMAPPYLSSLQTWEVSTIWG